MKSCGNCGWCHLLSEEKVSTGVAAICLEHLDENAVGENLKLTIDDLSGIPEGCVCYARCPSGMDLADFMVWQNGIKAGKAARASEKTARMMGGVRFLLGIASAGTTLAGIALAWLALPDTVKAAIVALFS